MSGAVDCWFRPIWGSSAWHAVSVDLSASLGYTHHTLLETYERNLSRYLSRIICHKIIVEADIPIQRFGGRVINFLKLPVCFHISQ